MVWMKRSARRPLALTIIALAGAAAAATPLHAQQPATTKPKGKSAGVHAADTASAPAAKDTVQHFSGVVGVAIDSIHGDKLQGATVTVLGTNRHGKTDALGEFRIDSVPPGEYRLTLSHPILDTVGLAVATQPIAMPLGRYAVVRLTTPSQSAVLGVYCPKERLVSGPSAVIGRVLDADTDAPDSGARVVLYWTQLEVSVAIGVKRTPRVREAHVDEHGMFSICGIPGNVQGELRASLRKQTTADVPVNNQGQLVTLALLHVSSPDTLPPTPETPTVATATNRTPTGAGPAVTGLRRGRAVLTGRVTDLQGRPLVGANLSVQGAAASTEAGPDGSYTLRGLPAGTQALVVRHLGFALTSLTVDLSNVNERHADVKMAPAPPMLAAVTVEGKRDKGLRDVGFTTRQKAGIGHYLTEEQIAQRQPMQMTDLLAQMPGIRMDYSTGYPVPTASRNAMGGCVSYVIDGVTTAMPDPTDFNDYMHPEEVSAMEIYSPSEAPAQFQTGGNSSCEVIVIWTKTKVGG
jgi:hypothetical protein